MAWSSIARRLRLLVKRLACAGGPGERDRERIVAWLAVEPGMRVADIGAGFGTWTPAFARAVGPGGVVYAVDTDADLRFVVARDAARLGLDHVRAVEAHPDASGLPEPVDLAFLSLSYHHLRDRGPYLERLRTELRPGARVAIVELRPARGLRVPGHATPPHEVRATMTAAGYRLVASTDLLAGHSLQVFAIAG